MPGGSARRSVHGSIAEEDAAFERRGRRFSYPSLPGAGVRGYELRESSAARGERDRKLAEGSRLTDRAFDAALRPGGIQRWLEEVVGRRSRRCLAAFHPHTPAPSCARRRSRRTSSLLGGPNGTRHATRGAQGGPEFLPKCAVRPLRRHRSPMRPGRTGSHLDLDNLPVRVRGALLEVFPALDPISWHRVYRRSTKGRPRHAGESSAAFASNSSEGRWDSLRRGLGGARAESRGSRRSAEGLLACAAAAESHRTVQEEIRQRLHQMHGPGVTGG